MDEATILAITFTFIGLGIPMSGIGSIYLGYCFLSCGAILSVYLIITTIKDRIIKKSGIKEKRDKFLKLKTYLDLIGKGHHSSKTIGNERNKFDAWKLQAIKDIFEIFGEAELNIFIALINAFIEKDEYHKIGFLEALKNEKDTYYNYLKNLMIKYPKFRL